MIRDIFRKKTSLLISNQNMNKFHHLTMKIQFQAESPTHLPVLSVWLCACMFSHVWLFATLWTIVHQAPLSVGFSRQEYWSALPCPLPGDLPNPGIEHLPHLSNITCIGMWVLYHWCHLGSPPWYITLYKTSGFFQISPHFPLVSSFFLPKIPH